MRWIDPRYAGLSPPQYHVLIPRQTGPREPTKETLYKFMLGIIIELRRTWETPILLRTPQHPEGVQCRIYLAAISCDRPAFNTLAGNAGQQSKIDMCSRCDITEEAFAAVWRKFDALSMSSKN